MKRFGRDRAGERAPGTVQYSEAGLVPVCDRCWNERGGRREAVRRSDPRLERCMWCACPTYSGTYTTI